MKTLVIVVTYNGMQWIDRCLGCVRASSVPADLMVVDNASTDGTAAYVKEKYPETILVENASNLGFAQGNNIGFRYALEHSYDSVYLLNQDAWFFPDTLAGLQKVSLAHPEFAILSPAQMQDGAELYNPVFERDVLPRLKPVDEAMHLGEVPFVMAAHWFVTAACLREVGLFEEMFSIYGNDDNYCHRVLYHGLKIGIVDSLRVVHDKQYAPQSLQYKMYRNFYISALVHLCDIRKPLAASLLYVLALSIVKLFKYRSFKVLGYLFKTLGKEDMSNVRRIRRETVKKPSL